MEINKQLFEDVLSGKLEGIFVLRNNYNIKSTLLERDFSSIYQYKFKPWCILYNNAGLADRLNLDNCNYDIIDFIPDTNMKENELTIEIPDNKVVDWDESKKQNKIILKDKQLTYNDICKKLFKHTSYYTNSYGRICSCPGITAGHITDPNNAPTKHQLECILAKNQLTNIAVYFNDGWKPIVGDRYTTLEYFYKSKDVLAVPNIWYGESSHEQIIFHNEEDAWKAIEILGEETVKLALEPLGI